VHAAHEDGLRQKYVADFQPASSRKPVTVISARTKTFVERADAVKDVAAREQSARQISRLRPLAPLGPKPTRRCGALLETELLVTDDVTQLGASGELVELAHEFVCHPLVVLINERDKLCGAG
jgi:hypothetical protein